MALVANNFIMSKLNLYTLLLVIFYFPSSSHGLTKNFVNTSMPDMRPTFVVNFDMATVICQHSDNPEDLHLHEISILCDGKNDCFNNPAMDDESFPYCEGKCNSTCNDRGACLYDGEKAQCYCNSGFHGTSCEVADINECQGKPCHWLAKCTNTINSTKCDCFPGFKGNGFECTDVDECAENLANCPEYSQCVNLPGTYFCNCTSGFMPKSALMPTCIDIDECSTDMHNCAENEFCQNTFGSFECVKECSTGYQLNGTVCDDVDECTEAHRCDKRATCENTNGGYKCICDEGFTGDGHSCLPITDCSKNENICHRHGFCIASLKMCICETGYAGDGLACHDINECETTENPCKDQSDNKCVNIEGGYICCDPKLNDQECIEEKGAYCSGGCGLHAICFNQTCTCVDGFEGDPKVKCNDVNECEDESICPGVGQWCVNMIGGYICCGRDSTHPECKGLEINAFNGNFGKGSISNAQLTEARNRGFFTHIIEKGERQENSSGGVVVVVRGNESESSGEAISSNGITFSFEIPTCNDNQNTTICPSNSECKQGRCTCLDGFEWSRSSGSCIDIDECEKLSQPCLIGADVWCVNLIGSYQCCNKSSSESECLGLEISAVDVSTGNGGLHTSGSDENGSKTTSKKKNPWAIETFGEWRNVTGGRAIIIEGKLESNVTETSTSSSTTMKGVSEIIHLPSASFVTKSDSEENGAEVESDEQTSTEAISTTKSMEKSTTDFDVSSQAAFSSIESDSSIEEVTTPLIPKSAPEQTKSTNPITKILENLGIITTKKVTSKPVMLITAGPNSIEAFDLNSPKEESSTSGYSESTLVIDQESTTNLPRTTSSSSTPVTKTTKRKQNSKNSKKFKTTPKFTKSTPAPTTKSTVTPVEQATTTDATTAKSTTNHETSQTILSSSKTTSLFETTPRIVDDTELSRSTDNFKNGEKESTIDFDILTSKATESTSTTSPHTSTLSIKLATKKKLKTKKPIKPTKAVPKNKKKVQLSTTEFAESTTTTPTKNKNLSTVSPAASSFSTPTTENDMFEMEAMVTMRSTTEKNAVTKSPHASKHSSTSTLPSSTNKGIEKINNALSTTITPMHLSTEFDIFIPDTPPPAPSQPQILINMTFSEHNITTTQSSDIFTEDVSIFTSSTLVDNFEENQNTSTSELKSSTNSPSSTLSIKKLFPLPPDINIKMINPEDITAQKLYTTTASTTILFELGKNVSGEAILPKSSFATEEMASTEKAIEIEDDISNISLFSTIDESNYTTLPYPKIPFNINQKTSTESSTTQVTETFTPFENTQSFTDTSTASTLLTSHVSHLNQFTSITSTISSPISQQTFQPSTVTNILGSTTESYAKVSTNENKFLTTTNMPLTTYKTFSTAFTTKRKGMEMIFVDEETTLASTDLTTITPIADLTDIPNGSTSNEILTSGEKGLEISVITTPFKQGSSTEIPDSGEMGLEISGKSSTSESGQPTKTTDIAETSTAINLPETEIENPESGEHLTQEEIERLKKLKANETSTPSILLTTDNPASTPSSLATTTEDLSKVKSGEMGLELSGASTPSSAEEFTSEPATAVSTTSEIEKAPISQTPALTTESATTASATKTEASGEKATSTAGEILTSASPGTSSPNTQTPPRSHEASFEKIPKSGEVGLEIGGNDLAGTSETTVASTSTIEIESTTSFETKTSLTSPEIETTEKAKTDSSKETSTQPSSLLPETTTINEEKASSKSSTSTSGEISSTSAKGGTSSETTPSETITDEPKVSSTSPSAVTEQAEKSSSASPEETSGSTAPESTTLTPVATSTPENEIQTTVLPSSSIPSISSETTSAEEISTVSATQAATTISSEISESTANPSPTPLTSPSTVQSEISVSTTPSSATEETSSTSSGETGLELTGRGFTTSASASSTTATKEETTVLVSTEIITEGFSGTTPISSTETPTTVVQSTTQESITEQTNSTEAPNAATSQSSGITSDGTSSESSSSPSTLAITTPNLEESTLTTITENEKRTTEGSTTLSNTPSSGSSLTTEKTEQSSTAISETEAPSTQPTAQASVVPESTTSGGSTFSTISSGDESTFVPDKIITDATSLATESLTSAAATTPQSSESTLIQTTQSASTEAILTDATTESGLSASPSTLEPTTESTTVSPITEVTGASSEESPSPSTENAAISTTFEPTYATIEAKTVFSSTESSVTDTLPTSETTKINEITTDISSTKNDQKSTLSTGETTPFVEITQTIGDVTTAYPSSTTSELLPPVIIVDKSRSHEEVDENSQLHHTSTAQPVTEFTVAETSPFTRISKTKCLSNDECEKDAYCERRSGACRCKPGFEGEPPQHPCQDIDECKQNLDDCHSSSRCLNYIGGYHCVCAIGYRKNANGVCEDVDECTLSNGTICDSHAVCRNLPGAYLCECNAGYTGDGYNCISIEKRHCNQNEWAKSDCGRNHFCLVDGSGKIDCDVCKNGFIMKNGICSDVNECEENSKLCHSDAICQNIMGGYQCRCQPGYAGDGHNCQDIDECGLQNSCHPQATCVNTPGSFMCECPEGWTGDGKNACLNPVNQKCSQRSEICKNGRQNSACLSLKVGDNFESTCECLPNYRYNATTLSCDDIDECSESRDNCDTANTVCVNTVGGFQCHCAAGYEGSGGICVDIDECKRGLAGCHVNAHCINRIGGVECRCGAGYTGDGTDCFPLDNRQIGGSDCNEDWVNMCRSQNKTCHIDDEEVPQCGSCMFGYQPMDGKCQPINALGNCADPSKNDCDANAECIDVRPGRHFCSCKIGFIGDGMHCDDVDECSIPRLCDFHATCKNTNGSYECQCKEGFIGNGFKCVPANQSQNCRISPEICHTNAGCQPDGTCKCLRGYEGDGVSECTRTSVTDGYDENETSTSRRPYYTTESFFTSTTTDLHCSARDRTACHVLATCDLDLGECVCRQGFMGDGYIACTRIWEDCTADQSMCHSNAICDSETKQCQCNLGYIGDGISCVPDKMDCIIRPNLCSEMAECVARRCVCGPGFTGDGSICMPVEPPQFIAGNCSLCHIQAICANGGCRCGQGCFGNGALCVPDPADCLNYPGVCHMNGYCDTTSRRCSCRKGFAGNGLDCSKRISCATDPSICHKDAKCLSDGRCECNHGLMGDGVECLKPLTAAEIFGTSAPQLIHFECPSSCGSNAECINGACKCSPGYIANENSVCTDIDECKMQTAQCHPHAECINQEGTYECRCLAGYSGNGKECSTAVLDNPDGLKVECKDDGLNVVLVEETSSFNGRIFVRGQSENPYCTKTFNGSEALPLSFHVPISHCDMQLEANDTLAVTVIIQKHSLFVTEQAYAYRLKCTYPTATRNIMSHYNVSEITTAETINTKGVEPACQLTVTNERNVTVDSAIVGQVLKLALFVLPNDSFTVLPRNCYAINLETSQRYTLTDEAGCAIDAQLFPEWTRINPSLTHAVFRTFKWPDSSMIRFECDCSACVAECPEINCERRREEQKAKMRFARDEGAVGIPESQDALWLKNSQTITKPVAAYSAVVVVMDDAEEQLAQKQVEEWLYKGNSHESEFFSNLDEDRICVSAPWAGLCLFSIILSISLLLTMTQIYKKRISKKKAELQNRTSNYNDNNSAYIKF